MQLTPYIESVASDLDRATQLADEATRDTARRLVSVLEPGLRLAMVQLLSDAAAQLTAELSGPVITVRMEGREPAWHVVPEEDHSPATQPDDEDDDNAARITLRLPENVKRRAENAAQSSGQSLNAWIVAALRRASHDSSHPHRSSRRITGWA